MTSSRSTSWRGAWGRRCATSAPHQSRGLLPPPRVRGRTGFYGPGHVAWLRLIQELQADGFNLELIRRLLAGAGGSSGELLRFKQALGQPFDDEQPATVDAAELIAQWGSASCRVRAS